MCAVALCRNAVACTLISRAVSLFTLSASSSCCLVGGGGVCWGVSLLVLLTRTFTWAEVWLIVVL